MSILYIYEEAYMCYLDTDGSTYLAVYTPISFV